MDLRNKLATSILNFWDLIFLILAINLWIASTIAVVMALVVLSVVLSAVFRVEIDTLNIWTIG